MAFYLFSPIFCLGFEVQSTHILNISYWFSSEFFYQYENFISFYFRGRDEKIQKKKMEK